LGLRFSLYQVWVVDSNDTVEGGRDLLIIILGIAAIILIIVAVR
jgi:hypothetical protein